MAFSYCNILLEGARALADLLSRGALPALENISLRGNTFIGDRGVVTPLGALQEVPRTFLSELDLSDVGMYDEGMVALASAIRKGCKERLTSLRLSRNIGVSDTGLIALAQAIDTRGLSWLQNLEMDVVNGARLTFLGFGAITHALVKGCPQLQLIRLRSDGKGDGQLQKFKQ